MLYVESIIFQPTPVDISLTPLGQIATTELPQQALKHRYPTVQCLVQATPLKNVALVAV
jgi:hypothetical protein